MPFVKMIEFHSHLVIHVHQNGLLTQLVLLYQLSLPQPFNKQKG
ncbi:hypothetical protein KDI_55000 [Dictyobacter arantiisoli]|uniref:Uncharacterized protein n=1 Tax=Dictyobacter arantiisoli TaxID=2014874 RepID=A0A5A5TLB4_9CHLR|nr:hypothetical protein KDI_55000 [Dictyobacter arantiisoli]